MTRPRRNLNLALFALLLITVSCTILVVSKSPDTSVDIKKSLQSEYDSELNVELEVDTIR